MDVTSIPLFAMLRSRMNYFSDRQRLVAENIANSETPGYRAQDLTPFSFRINGSGSESPTVMQVTNPGHMRPSGPDAAAAASGFRTERRADTVTTLDGNQVSLEDEMMRMSDSRMNYEAAIGFYQKSMSMIRTAARAPGR
jgi:flagellar basal-body rod protein FlgB